MAYGSTLDIFYGYRYYRFNIMTLITIVCPVSKKDQGAVFPGVPFFLSILFLEEISPTAKGLNIYQTVNQHKKNPHHAISSQCFSILFRQDNAIHRIRTTYLRTACCKQLPYLFPLRSKLSCCMCNSPELHPHLP